jgi:hypothetical protein
MLGKLRHIEVKREDSDRLKRRNIPMAEEKTGFGLKNRGHPTA